MELKALGNSRAKFERLEAFEAPAGLKSVECSSDEVTAVCPVTGQPDWYVVEITYEPFSLCVESKSLKLYLQSLKDEGMFCEALAVKIRNDIHEAIKPVSCRVRVTQKSRGGVVIKAVA
jgi:7-cyano-7-deazaguanine reductase